jgi:glutaminase
MASPHTSNPGDERPRGGYRGASHKDGDQSTVQTGVSQGGVITGGWSPSIARLNTITPGVAFGDLALFDGGSRSASVVADRASTCYVLPIDRLEALAARHPEIRTRLIANVVRELWGRLRNADAEIRSLEE